MRPSKKIWTIIRTFTFLLIGLMNTVWARPEDIGSWKNYLGYFLLVLFLIDGSVLLYQALKSTS